MLTMSPLQILRIFDYQQPKVQIPTSGSLRSASAPQNSSTQVVGKIQEERRKNDDRRSADRREKQQATFLNTRKTQGRRQTPGRRSTDINGRMDYRPISLKG